MREIFLSYNNIKKSQIPDISNPSIIETITIKQIHDATNTEQ
jgi:hypothetical protein